VKHKKILTLVLVVVAIASLILAGCVGPTPAPEEKEVHLVFGSGSKPTSSYFPFHATTSQLVDAASGVRATLTITAGSVGGAMQILRGEDVDIAGGIGLAVMYQMTHGLGKWEGEPLPNDLRVLFTYLTGFCPVVVRADSGVDSIADLDGRVYGLGFPGSSSETLFVAAFDVLGYDVETYPGSYKDAVEDIKDNRMIGYAKVTPSNSLDAALLEVMVANPLKIIGFTDAEVGKITSEIAYVSFREMPAGFYGIEHPAISVMEMPMVWVCHKDMSEDVAYAITKSVVEGWEEKLHKVFPNMANDDPLDTPSYAAKVEGVFVHPGSLRYFQEMGVEIPESAIPPEMK